MKFRSPDKRAFILHTSYLDCIGVTSLNGQRAKGHHPAQKPDENYEHMLHMLLQSKHVIRDWIHTTSVYMT